MARKLYYEMVVCMHATESKHLTIPEKKKKQEKRHLIDITHMLQNKKICSFSYKVIHEHIDSFSALHFASDYLEL